MSQRVLDVARQPYALTLYTAWQLSQLRRRDHFEREAERHDLASLIAFATHEPQKLDALRSSFLDFYRPRTGRIEVITNRFARTRDLVARHATLQPIDPPPE